MMRYFLIYFTATKKESVVGSDIDISLNSARFFNNLTALGFNISTL